MERAVDRLFVTGTDTGVGKTVVSAALLHAFRAHGRRAVGMKPVASGCERAPEGWRNEDALALQAASDPRPPYDDVNPYALPAPLAPEIAARDAGVDVQLGVLVSAFERLHPLADMVLVEGVGGWAAPLTATLDQRHLVQDLLQPQLLGLVDDDEQHFVVFVRDRMLGRQQVVQRQIAGVGDVGGCGVAHVTP